MSWLQGITSMIHLRSQINLNHLKLPATDHKSNQDIEFSAYKINIRHMYFSFIFFQIGIQQISFYNLIVIFFYIMMLTMPGSCMSPKVWFQDLVSCVTKLAFAKTLYLLLLVDKQEAKAHSKDISSFCGRWDLRTNW